MLITQLNQIQSNGEAQSNLLVAIKESVVAFQMRVLFILLKSLSP